MPRLYSLGLEEGFVAGLILGEYPAEVFELAPGDFHYDHLREVYVAARSLHARGLPVDICSLSHALLEAGHADDVTWNGEEAEEYLIGACHRWGFNAISMYPLPFGGMIADYARRRRMMQEAQVLAQAAHGLSWSVYGPAMGG